MRKRRMRIAPAIGTVLIVVVASFSAVANAGVDVWTSGGPYGGDIRALAIEPTTPTTLYAGTKGSGIFKSTNSGSTWVPANTGLTDTSSLTISVLAISRLNPATIYAGTLGSGVFKSMDSGETWAAANVGLTSPTVNALAIDPAQPTVLYAGTVDGGLFKSTDSGGTWAAANDGLTSLTVNAVAIVPTAPATLFVGTQTGGVFKSSDSGGTWAAANAGLTKNVIVSTLAIDPIVPTTLYAGTYSAANPECCWVYRSTDSGDTWAIADDWIRNSFHVFALAIDPTMPTTLYAGTKHLGIGAVLKSTDSGHTWVAASNGQLGQQVNALAIDSSRTGVLYAGTDGGGISKSIDSGGTWGTASTGLMAPLTVQVLAIDRAAPSTLYAGTNLNGIFKSTNSGATWTGASTGLTNLFVTALSVDPLTPSTIYAGTAGGFVFRSRDSGGTWTQAGDRVPTGVGVLAIDPTIPSTLYAGIALLGVFKSIDSGGTWTAANNGLPGRQVTALAIDPATPTTLYVALEFCGVFKSTDSGGSWVPASTGLPDFNIVFSAPALAINPATPSTLYVGIEDGRIFKSTNSGETWVATGRTSGSFLEGLVINSANPSTLYARTFRGVERSTDSGRTWTAIGTGLPEQSVLAIALDPAGPTTVFAGLSLGSVWQWTPAAEPTGSLGFVPIVLDVVGLAHYTSELQLTNLGADSATVKLSYTSSIGSGIGDVTETIPAGQQAVYTDAISHLRFKGVSIPTSGNQGGTLLLSSPAGKIRATLRTAADTVAPQPVGRAGLAYSDTDPAASSSLSKVYVYGLRTSDSDRSNLAVYNMGPDPVSLKVTLVSGDLEVTAGAPLSLPAYGWYQYSGVLSAAGFSSGYAIVERVGGSGPFGAYGVVNDQMTNDGSFIPALPDTISGSKLTIPVLVETNAFESELILTNRGSTTATFTLRYVESLSPAKGAGGTATVDVPAGRQRIIPNAIDFLRSKGVSLGARGDTSYAGSLQVQVSGVGLENAFAGARTSSLSPAGGEFGVFYPGIGSSQESSEIAFVLGLKADANNRSNVAVLHTGDAASGPITLELQVLDGSEGGRAAGQPLLVNLNPGQWAQPSGFFAGGGVPNGYVRIRRTSGTAPWYAYGVINDGGQPGQRTGDGSYVPGVQP